MLPFPSLCPPAEKRRNASVRKMSFPLLLLRPYTSRYFSSCLISGFLFLRTLFPFGILVRPSRFRSAPFPVTLNILSSSAGDVTVIIIPVYDGHDSSLTLKIHDGPAQNSFLLIYISRLFYFICAKIKEVATPEFAHIAPSRFEQRRLRSKFE